MCGVWESSWPGEGGPVAVGAGKFLGRVVFRNMLSKSQQTFLPLSLASLAINVKQ